MIQEWTFTNALYVYPTLNLTRVPNQKQTSNKTSLIKNDKTKVSKQ